MSRVGLFDVGTFDEAEFNVIGDVSDSYGHTDSAEIRECVVLSATAQYSYTHPSHIAIALTYCVTNSYVSADSHNESITWTPQSEYSYVSEVSAVFPINVKNHYSYSAEVSEKVYSIRSVSSTYAYSDSTSIAFAISLSVSSDYGYSDNSEDVVEDGIATGDTWIWTVKDTENYSITIENNVAKFTATWGTSPTEYSETFNHLSLSILTMENNEYVAGIIPVMKLTKTNRQAVNVVYHILLD